MFSRQKISQILAKKCPLIIQRKCLVFHMIEYIFLNNLSCDISKLVSHRYWTVTTDLSWDLHTSNTHLNIWIIQRVFWTIQLHVWSTRRYSARTHTLVPTLPWWNLTLHILSPFSQSGVSTPGKNTFLRWASTQIFIIGLLIVIYY